MEDLAGIGLLTLGCGVVLAVVLTGLQRTKSLRRDLEAYLEERRGWDPRRSVYVVCAAVIATLLLAMQAAAAVISACVTPLL